MSEIITTSKKPGGLSHNQLSHSLDTVEVQVYDIKLTLSHAVEEIFQFSVGGFMFSGAFWVGVERFITEVLPHKKWDDILFIACCIFCFTGIFVSFFGYRQLKRRAGLLGKYLPEHVK